MQNVVLALIASIMMAPLSSLASVEDSPNASKPYISGSISCIVGGVTTGLSALVDSVPLVSAATTMVTYMDNMVGDSRRVYTRRTTMEMRPTAGFSVLGIFSLVPETAAIAGDFLRDGRLYDDEHYDFERENRGAYSRRSAGNEYVPGEIVAQTYVMTLATADSFFADEDSLCRQLLGSVEGFDARYIYAVDERDIAELEESNKLVRLL